MSQSIGERIKLKVFDFVGRGLPSCEAITASLSRSMDEPLSLPERIRVKLHFLICLWCRRYERQMNMLRSVARDHSSDDAEDDQPSLSPEARERIRRSLARGG